MIFYFLVLFLNLNSAFSITWYGNFANFNTWDLKYSLWPEHRTVVNDPLGGTDKVLRVKYPIGSYSSTVPGGTAFYVYVFQNISYGHASFEYDVLFPNEWDWVKGGKLPGMFGGRAGCNGGYSASDCFSTRYMWGPGGGGYAYIYIPKNAPHLPEFCQLTGDPTCSQQYGFGLAGFKYFDKNRWVKLKQEVKLNTPGVPNGRLAIWVDNVLRWSYDKIIFRTTNMVPINGIVFETFFGGNTPDWAPSKDVYAYFKNFKFDVL